MGVLIFFFLWSREDVGGGYGKGRRKSRSQYPPSPTSLCCTELACRFHLGAVRSPAGPDGRPDCLACSYTWIPGRISLATVLSEDG